MRAIRIVSNTPLKCSTKGCPGFIMGMGYDYTIEVDGDTGCLTVSGQDAETNCPICNGLMQDDKEKILVFFMGKLIHQLNKSDYEYPVIIQFESYKIIGQVLGSENEFMNSELTFKIKKLEEPESEYREFTTIVRQPAGESFSYHTSPLEVETPPELVGKLVYSEFRDAVKEYYSKAFGPDGNAIRTQGEMSIVGLQGVTIMMLFCTIVNGRNTAGHGGW